MFYDPVPIMTRDVPTLIYPSKGLEKVMSREEAGALEAHVQDIMGRVNFFDPALYNVVIPWEKNGQTMTDVRLYAGDVDSEFGPQHETIVFRGVDKTEQEGDGCGNSAILYGYEEFYRQSKFKMGERDITKLVFGKRPYVPSIIMMRGSFNIPSESVAAK